jgi:MFS family permease
MSPSKAKYAWYRELNGYQWFVLLVCSFAWMFDLMTQQLFSQARKQAVRELLGGHASDAAVAQQAGYATSVLMIGWASGGVLFGMLGDRIGRVKTMALTILFYSLFTGASMFATGIWDFNLYRFLCGLGVGGLFSVGVSLVAEVVPPRARPYALGTLQAFSTIGNMLAAGIGIGLGLLERSGAIVGAWRYEFLAGAIPAPLALLVLRKLKEPDPWLKARAAKTPMGSWRELVSEPPWGRNAIAGLLLAVAGVVGLWGVGYFSYDLFLPVLEKTFRAQGLSGAALTGKTTTWIGITSLLQNFGAFWGIYAFTYLTHYTGRKKAFAIAFPAAMCITAYTFWNLRAIGDVFWMVPLMGFAQLALFGGYAIYLPELFPTRLRSTGTSFCYNMGRLIAAFGPIGLGYLTATVFAGYAEPMRYAGVAMCPVFLLGLVPLLFAPETKGVPLPE